jgi:predicted nucleotidyltransferase
MSEVPKSVLDEMVRVIVDAIDPERIIMFGSHARGNAGPDSDVDILVVDPKPYNENRSRISLFEKLLRRLLFFPFPLDLLLYSKDEVEDWKDSRHHVIGTAIREGKVLYERG